MANAIEKAKIYLSDMLDEKMIQETTTAWMDQNSNGAEYTGGNEIKIPKMSFDGGLGGYTRDTGYKSKTATLEYETHSFDLDRSAQFTLDSMDVDESKFAISAAKLVGEFTNTQINPETDAYRYSKIFSRANALNLTGEYTPNSSTIFSKLSNDIALVQDKIGEGVQLVIAMSFNAANVLDQADQIEKRLEVKDFTNGGISTKTKFINEIPILRVSSARFKSEFTFSNSGFTPSATAMGLNWVIIAKAAPLGIVKHSKLKVFDPDTVQSLDGWLIQTRILHTLVIPDNKMASVWVSYLETAAPALTATVAQGAASGATKFTATAGSGNTLGYTLTAAAATGYLNTKPTITAYTSGSDITATAGQFLNMFELNSAGRIAKFSSHELAAGDIKA